MSQQFDGICFNYTYRTDFGIRRSLTAVFNGADADKAICRNEESEKWKGTGTFFCQRWRMMRHAASPNLSTPAGWLSPPVFQLKYCSVRWNQSPLRWSHKPKGRERHVFAVAAIHQVRQAYSPLTERYSGWQSAVEVTISIQRPVAVSGQWLWIGFSQFAVLCQIVRDRRLRGVLLSSRHGWPEAETST